MRLTTFLRALFGAACILTAVPAAAAEAPTPSAPQPSEKALQLAHRLIAAMHMDQMMGNAIKGMTPGLLEQTSAIPGPGSAEDRAAITQDLIDAMQAMMEKAAVLMNEKAPPLYAATFTEVELKDMVDFYESPSGQATLTKMPELMKQISPLMSELMPAYLDDLQARLCARNKAYCRMIKPKPAGSAP